MIHFFPPFREEEASVKPGRLRLCRGWLGMVLALAGGSFVFGVSALAQSAPAAPTVVLGGDPGRPGRTAPAPAATPARSTPGGDLRLNIEREGPPPMDVNHMILAVIEKMPRQGGYRASGPAFAALRRAIQPADSQLHLECARATPSFCSGATYLVFLSVLDELQNAGRIRMDEETVRALLVQDHQPDGSGVWGRWNANGPGTARLFFEAGLGRNFASFDEARPGDFLKVWWNAGIGSTEAGHSVVFLGMETRPEGQFVRFWSSNIPDGFGAKEIPRQKIKRALFSRLEHPERIVQVTAIPPKDAYLAAMLKRPSSVPEMAELVGLAQDEVPFLAIADAAPAPGAARAAPAAAPVAPAGVAPATPRPSIWNKLNPFKKSTKKDPQNNN